MFNRKFAFKWKPADHPSGAISQKALNVPVATQNRKLKPISPANARAINRYRLIEILSDLESRFRMIKASNQMNPIQIRS